MKRTASPRRNAALPVMEGGRVVLVESLEQDITMWLKTGHPDRSQACALAAEELANGAAEARTTRFLYRVMDGS